ncbi:MAG: ribonuclease HII [Sphingomonadales bacterium]|nr:ribonuclease HII [Sphingomonadales bacterium]MDE2168601.1 ribonuclease HII [Sphingomonadales bacterium]
MTQGWIIGVDEAGRGPLAGPVVAGAVALPLPIAGLADSKKLSGKKRAVLEEQIKAQAHWATGLVEVEEIDRINIFAATMLAMTKAVADLAARLDGPVVQVLVDGNLTPAGRVAGWEWSARAIVGGDAIEPVISAASIIAKEHRDRLMRELDVEFPHYGWARNAGYGTAEHMAALRSHGPCAHHRRSFAPVAQLVLI